MKLKLTRKEYDCLVSTNPTFLKKIIKNSISTFGISGVTYSPKKSGKSQDFWKYELPLKIQVE